MDISLIFGYPLGWVMWLFYQVVQNYGVAILLFTLFTRVLLYPLGVKQQKSSARMAIFQPKIAALQKKYKNNKQKLQEERLLPASDPASDPLRPYQRHLQSADPHAAAFKRINCEGDRDCAGPGWFCSDNFPDQRHQRCQGGSFRFFITRFGFCECRPEL